MEEFFVKKSRVKYENSAKLECFLQANKIAVSMTEL